MISYLIAAILGMLGWAAIQGVRMGGLQALLNNFKTDQKINTLDDKIAKNDGNAQAQEQVRDYIQEHLDKEKNGTQGDNLESLRDFFNDPNKK